MARTIPRTTKVTATGSCGHEFARRIPVKWPLAGQERTPENVVGLEEYRAEVADRMATHTCDLCMSAATLAATRAAVDGLAAVLDRPAPPKLEGSPGLLAFAEGVRADRVWTRAHVRLMEARDALRYPSVGDQFTLAALRQAWPEHPWAALDASASSDVNALAGQMGRAAAANFGARATLGLTGAGMGPAEWLAVWLVLRADWTEDFEVFAETRPRAWIARSRRGNVLSGSRAKPARATVDAAILVARIGGWEDRWDADAAFATLLRETSSLTGLLHQPGYGTLRDRLLSASVMDALGDR